MSELCKIRDYLITRLEELEWSSGSGIDLKFPEYDLNAYNYLEYAYPDLEAKSNGALISCVSHLKRATDCQLDTFLHAIGLEHILSKANLKFEKKLEMISLTGIFKSKILVNLNKKRNALEHKYNIPDIGEEGIQVYYEMVWAFIELLEAHMIMLSYYGNQEWTNVGAHETDVLTDVLSVELDEGVLYFEIRSDLLSYKTIIKPVDESSVKEFLIGLNILFLLIKANGMWSSHWIIERLKLLDIVT